MMHGRGEAMPTVRKTVWTSLAIAIVLFVGVIFVLCTDFKCNRRKWRCWRSQAQLARFSMALDEYRSELGRYPPDTGYGLGSAKSPGTYDAGSLWRYLVQSLVDPNTGKKIGPFLEEWREGYMVAYDDPKLGPSFRLTDPWGNPFGFVGEAKRVVHNPGSFDLFSVGPDGVTASDREGAAPNLAYDEVDNDGNGKIDDASELGAAARNGDIGDDVNNWSTR
jgi:type II secretory pathway pseudopilin PulG